jgi:hypothetical protein
VNKWFHETDPRLKLIFAAKGGLSQEYLSRKEAQKYPQGLKVITRRLAYVPATLIAIGLCRQWFHSLKTEVT